MLFVPAVRQAASFPLQCNFAYGRVDIQKVISCMCMKTLDVNFGYEGGAVSVAGLLAKWSCILRRNPLAVENVRFSDECVDSRRRSVDTNGRELTVMTRLEHAVAARAFLKTAVSNHFHHGTESDFTE